jgi:thioredoxin
MKRLTLTVFCLVLLGLSGVLHAQEATKVQELSTTEFKEKIWDYSAEKEWKYLGDKPVILDFYAGWCGPCRRLSPILDEIQQEMGGKIQIYKINVDREKELSRMFGANAIPLLFFIPGEGDGLVKANGALPKEQLMQIINEHLLKKNKS